MASEKVILITGASSGIGAALAAEYADKYVKLILMGRSAERLNKVQKDCESKGAQVIAKTIDVESKDEMESFIKSLEQIDIVFANAGISAGTSSEKGLYCESAAQVRKIFSVNVDGVLNTTLPAIEKMQERKSGQIVIISSLAGFRGLPSSPSYSASKAAVRYFGEAIRGVLKKDGIKVTVVTPGYIKTPMTDKNDFPMPFMMRAEKCAKIIKRKLLKNPSRISFPLPLYIPIMLLGALPPRFTDFIFERLPGKKPF